MFEMLFEVNMFPAHALYLSWFIQKLALVLLEPAFTFTFFSRRWAKSRSWWSWVEIVSRWEHLFTSEWAKEWSNNKVHQHFLGCILSWTKATWLLLWWRRSMPNWHKGHMRSDKIHLVTAIFKSTILMIKELHKRCFIYPWDVIDEQRLRVTFVTLSFCHLFFFFTFLVKICTVFFGGNKISKKTKLSHSMGFSLSLFE